MSEHQTRRVMQHSDFSLSEPSISVDLKFFKRFSCAHSPKYSSDLNCSLDTISREFHPRIAGYSSYECCRSFDYSYSEALKEDPKLILRSLARLAELLDLSTEEVFKYCRLDSNLNWEPVHVPNLTEDKRFFWIALENGKEMVEAADNKKTAREPKAYAITQAPVKLDLLYRRRLKTTSRLYKCAF